MSGYISIDIRCMECSHLWNDLVLREEAGKIVDCPECKQPAGRRTISAPRILKASYPDGHKRAGWAEMREQEKLATILRNPKTSNEDKKYASNTMAEISIKGAKPKN